MIAGCCVQYRRLKRVKAKEAMQRHPYQKNKA